MDLTTQSHPTTTKFSMLPLQLCSQNPFAGKKCDGTHSPPFHSSSHSASGEPGLSIPACESSEERKRSTFPTNKWSALNCLQWLKWNCRPRPPPSVCWQARHTTSTENAGYQWVHWSLKIKSKSLVSFREGNVFPATPKRVSTHCAPPMLCVLSPRPQTRSSGLLVDTKISFFFFFFPYWSCYIIQGFRKMQHETRREEKLVGLGWTISKKILPCPGISCYLAL